MSKPEQCPCGRLRPTPHFAQELLLWTYHDQPHSQRTSLLWEALETTPDAGADTVEPRPGPVGDAATAARAHGGRREVAPC